MPKHQFDLVVIGTGPGASASIDRCRDAGWSVAVVDSRPLGGTCALTGCVPKKVLCTAPHLLDRIHRLNGFGLRADQPRINWNELVRYKRTFTEPVPGKVEKKYHEKRIVVFHGPAQFISPEELTVHSEQIRFRHAVIATGQKPRPTGIKGEELMVSSDQFMELDELPEGILFVGGGYVSMEFAHIAARSGGCKVCVYERGSQVLHNFEPDIVQALVEESRRIGVDIFTGKLIESIAINDRCCHVNSESHTFRAEMIVHGAGRIAAIDDLGLERANVERTDKGVMVNEFLQTTNPAIYSAGDCADTGGLPLTPIAGLEGKAVSLNLIEGNKHRVDYRGTPSVIFTTPPLASVGMRESEAQLAGIDFEVSSGELDSWFSWKHLREPGRFKVLVDRKSGQILGAHLFGYRADEVINLFALAIRHGLTREQLKNSPLAFPTCGHDVRYML